MGSARSLFAATAVAGVISASAWPALAYVRSRSVDNEYAVIWPDPHITLSLYTGTSMVDPADFVGAATEAAATWSAPRAETSVTFLITSKPDALSAAAYDQENTISFQASSWNPPAYPSGALALTTIWTRDGRILEADTEINAVDPRFHWAVLPDDPAVAVLSTDDDLQNALTHELGHALGLAHPCYLGALPPDPLPVDNYGQPILSCADAMLPGDVLSATMFPSSDHGKIGERALSPDEVMALQDLYPAGRAPIVEGPGEEPTGGGCAVATVPADAPLSPMPLALLASGIAIAVARSTGSRRSGT